MIDLAGKRIFCTGLSGFLGTNLALRLSREGASLDAIVLENEIFHDLPNLRIHRGRIESRELLSRIFDENRYDFVIHLAATATVQEAFANPREAFETNIEGTWNLLETIRRKHPEIRGIIHASTDKVYGEGKSRPYREDDPIEARHVYDVSKAAGDFIARGYFHNYALPVSVARFCNIYGPHDLNWGRIIPGTIRAIHENRPPIIKMYLDENGIHRPFRRDFIHIDDVVEGLLGMLEAASKGEHYGEAFNFGTEKFHAVDDLVAAICRICGKSPQCEIKIVASGEIHSQNMSYEKAGKLLGFTPKIAFEDGLESTVGWYLDYLEKNEHNLGGRP